MTLCKFGLNYDTLISNEWSAQSKALTLKQCNMRYIRWWQLQARYTHSAEPWVWLGLYEHSNSMRLLISTFLFTFSLAPPSRVTLTAVELKTKNTINKVAKKHRICQPLNKVKLNWILVSGVGQVVWGAVVTATRIVRSLIQPAPP